MNTAELKKMFPIGSTVCTDVTHVSRSGMMRRIRCYVVRRGQLKDVTQIVADVLGYSTNDQGMRVTGVGMDMGFAVVYALSSKIYEGSRSKKIEPYREGYAIKQEWL